MRGNVNMSAVMAFGKCFVEGNWKWGNRICLEHRNIHTWGFAESSA